MRGIKRSVPPTHSSKQCFEATHYEEADIRRII